MNTIIFPEDVDNVIQSFIMMNEGDEVTENIILAIGAELLDISLDAMLERVHVERETTACNANEGSSLEHNCETGIYDCNTCTINGECIRQENQREENAN